ncbi:hypothetical protein HN748_04910 [Candidatus Peregrinibacteria bacterium]|nr:hypothetical protein [Candidatus Peregrinibacteria bacterium]MBT7484386.1 hypothetical protein [Candidatus Peregrinibacteria bacterium]MBT7703550.1 hypothetical protein [Candidatus Peregrinibacteria bacterium]
MKKSILFLLASLLCVSFLAGCMTDVDVPVEDPIDDEVVVEIIEVEEEISGSPKLSVSKFVNDVLVDPPFDYEAAGEYLVPSLHDQFDNVSGFVPLTFGIQDHPGSVTVNDAEMFDDSAKVRVMGHYDATELIWDFTVVVYENEWKIAGIEKALE